MPQIVFVLYFLSHFSDIAKIREKFFEEISFVERVVSENPSGLGVVGYLGSTTDPDCDMTALGNIVCTKLGLRGTIKPEDFEQFWNEQLKCYELSSMPLYIVEHMMHVLEAVLVHPSPSLLLPVLPLPLFLILGF